MIKRPGHWFLLLCLQFTVANLFWHEDLLALSEKVDLRSVSEKINLTLPESFDAVTKLMKTTAENNYLINHFIIDASQKEYDWAMPKVKSQVMSTICTKAREKMILKQLKANIVYRYENTKGQSLGEFMVKPEDCAGK